VSLAPFARLFYFVRKEDILRRPPRRWILAEALLTALVFWATQDSRATRHERGQIVAANAATNTVTDETGRSVTVPVEVKRIVTLAPNLTETVFALGLGERLVGDTKVCDTPPEAKQRAHVGMPVNPNLEAVVALHPDLVLATTSINRAESVDALRRLGIPVYTSDPHTVRGMLDSTARMAEIAGAATQGAALVTRLQERLDAVHVKLADLPLVHVLFVVWEDPLISIGQNTFVADALRWAGAESVIVSKQNWPRVNLEEIVRIQPEYIILTSDHRKAEEAEASDLRSRAGWRDLRAVEMGHVAVISAGVDRPSPGLVDAIEELARLLHPHSFAMENESSLHDAAIMSEEIAQCAL